MVMASRERWPLASERMNSAGCRVSTRTVMCVSPLRPGRSGGWRWRWPASSLLQRVRWGWDVQGHGWRRTQARRRRAGRAPRCGFPSGEAARTFSASATLKGCLGGEHQGLCLAAFGGFGVHDGADAGPLLEPGGGDGLLQLRGGLRCRRLEPRRLRRRGWQPPPQRGLRLLCSWISLLCERCARMGGWSVRVKPAPRRSWRCGRRGRA